MKFLRLTIMSLVLTGMVFAGGMVTNTNHSALFISMLNRNASTDIDATYFNPAGLTKLDQGLHFYLSSQTVFQTRTVTVFDERYNVDTFEGTTFAPVFPNFFAAYKKDKMVLSFGFEPIGGGGSAEFSDGLPSFDRVLMEYVGLPTAIGEITGYSLTSSFTGTSLYLAGQVNVSYELNEMLSLAGGARYISAKNTYVGSLSEPRLSSASAVTNPLTPIEELNVDSERSGSGIALIAGVNITLNEALNIALKYETKVALVMTSSTTVDDTKLIDEKGIGMFPDNTDYNSDMPSVIGVGIGFDGIERMHLQTSFNYYLNSGVNWDGKENKVDNGFEGGIGGMFAVSESLELLFGGLYAQGGATDAYQEDLSYSLNSVTVGTGIRLHISPNLLVNTGLSNTFYTTGTNGKSGAFASFNEEYDKTALDIALGLEYHF
ncbi:hypothetical protein KAJ27_18065 [bacterium]|nr:hypothetical protein [bacterium]